MITSDLEKLQSDGLVLVYFWHPGCSICALMAPAINEVGQHDLPVVKVNLAEQPPGGVGQQFKITKLPAVILLQNGQEVARLEGLAPFAELDQFIKRGSNHGDLVCTH
jgi:thioredoxin 1